MKKTTKITNAQATNLEILIAEYLRVKADQNNYNVYFRKTKNYTSYADTLTLCYAVNTGRGTDFHRYYEVANGQQTKSVLYNCPLRVFQYKNVQIEWGSNRMREELHIDFAALLMDPKGAEILANATALAKVAM